MRAPPRPPIFTPKKNRDEVEEAKARYQSRQVINDAVQKGKVTFVEGDWLREHTAKGKKVPPCQDLPEQAKYTGPIDDNVLVLVVSYCWASKTHPDPQAKIMKEVCEFIEYLEKSRHYDKNNPDRSAETSKKMNESLQVKTL